MDITKNQNGHEQTYIHGAYTSDFSKFIDPSIPYIWIEGHIPNQRIEWWKATVPLNKHGEPITGLIRTLVYDLMLPTKEFLAGIKLFDDHGIRLVQAMAPIPNTLDLSRVPELKHDEILIQNGAVLRIYLPHSDETAMITSYRQGYLAEVAARG
jgi:hypothetical protein